MRYVKTCSRCSEEKHMSNFYPHKRGRYGVGTICKPCNTEKAIEYRKTEASAPLRYVTSRRAALKAKYGLTLEEYDQMFEEQGGVCAICLQPEKQDKLLAVDHCHNTNKVRGLLCSACNIGIGNLKDDPLVLRRASDYLILHGG